MTEKQRRFVDFYISNGGNATAAAKAAGYSTKTAYSIGDRLLKNVEVSQAIEKRLEEMSNSRQADATEILEFLAATMRGEIQSAEQAATVRDRVRAAEILAKIHRIDEKLASPETANEDVIICLPPKQTLQGNASRLNLSALTDEELETLDDLLKKSQGLSRNALAR